MKFVCPRTFVNSARTAGPIGAGVAPIDALKRRNDIGAGRGSAGGTWHVARAAPSRSTKIFLAPLEVKRGESLNPNSQATRVLYELKIRWGYRAFGVPAARARGEEAVLTWGPPVKVNFELATPNSVHGCTLARPTWRRMKKGARVHSARAVHLQVFSTHHFLAAEFGIGGASRVPLRTREAPPIPNSQVARIPYQLFAIPCFPSIYAFVVTVPLRCRLRAPGPEKFIWEGSSGSRKF